MLTEKNKTAKKIFAMVLSAVLVITSMLPAFSAKANASDGTIKLNVGRQIDYGDGSNYTNYFTVGSKGDVAYCVQPQLKNPPSGNYDYEILSPTSKLAKVMYYGYGGAGFDEYTAKKFSDSWSGDDQYVVTHIVAAICYDETTSQKVDPFEGLPDGAVKNKAVALYNYIISLPNPPKNFTVFRIRSGNNQQDILGAVNQTGSLSITKKSANPSITDGNSCYSLAGAKYGLYYGNELIETLTTNENGVATADNILIGSYTLKEISAPKGYALDTNTYSIKITNDNKTTKTVSDIPQNDPVSILLQKIDTETGESATSC